MLRIEAVLMVFEFLLAASQFLLTLIQANLALFEFVLYL